MRTQQEIHTAFADRDTLDGFQSFFLVGIGGAGMSAVARMLQSRGFMVKGTDLNYSDLIGMLVNQGMLIKIGHSGEHLGSKDALVLSDAIDLETSPEVARARELGVPLFRRSQVLGWLLKDKKTIAVTGTHGKTTTTSFLALAMRAAGLDPTVVVGAEVPELGGAVSEGSGEYAVVEACEAYDSLHDFDPYHVVLNNLEPDHLDFHGSWEILLASLTRLVTRIPEGGRLIYNSGDKGACEVAQQYGRADAVAFEAGVGEKLAGRPLHLRQKGDHNRANADAALSVLGLLGAVSDSAVGAIENFGGAKRRQEMVFEGTVAGLGWDITVLDDYGHHPTEVKAALQAIREGWVASGLRKRLVVVFQPHLYSRTAPLINEFAEALDEADLVVLTDIYPAREAPMAGISSFRIAEKVTKPCHYVPSRHLLPREVAGWVQDGDVVVGMGAGNIEYFPRPLVAELERLGRGPKIMVAYGGDSTEREVSLHSGRAVYDAVVRLGYEAELCDLSELALSKGDLGRLVGVNRPDLVLLTTHGGNGENGSLQGFLEFMHLRYTGPGVRASSLAISKEESKKVYVQAGMPVARGALLRAGDELPDWEGPYVVKPNSHGSTVGLAFVESRSELGAAVEKCFKYDSEVLVEELLRGVEISVPVLGDRALLPVEVVPASGRYDFASKYEAGATEEICPARISQSAEKLAMDYALKAHQALGCRGATRTDMFVDGEKVTVVETNTVPGMTPTSLIPRSAKEMGMSFDDVVEWMIQDGLKSS